VYLQGELNISVQNNTMQSKHIFMFLVHTSSCVHYSKELVPQGTRKYSNSQILKVQYVGVYVYLQMGGRGVFFWGGGGRIMLGRYLQHTCITFQVLIHVAPGCLFFILFLFISLIAIVAIGWSTLC
jgi:hypothetical protein